MPGPYYSNRNESFFDIWKDWAWDGDEDIAWLTGDTNKKENTVFGIALRAFDPLGILGAIIYGAWKAYDGFDRMFIREPHLPRRPSYYPYPYPDYPYYPAYPHPYGAYDGRGAYHNYRETYTYRTEQRDTISDERREISYQNSNDREMRVEDHSGIIVVPELPDEDRFRQIYLETLERLERI